MVSFAARGLSGGLLLPGFILWALALLAGCEGTKPDRAAVTPPDPLWAPFIASHTSGVISRTARVRILFATDVVDEARVGEDASASLRIEPSVAGAAEFVSTRELVFTPDRDLTPGAVHRVALQSAGLRGVPAKLAPFTFVVDVKRPEFEVSIGGLTADAGEDRSLTLSGAIATADAESADKIEKLLSANYAGRPMAITWQDSGDAQRHTFLIRGLQRGVQEQTLHLAWDGEPIGARTRGQRELAIPARDRFIVTQVSAADEAGQRYIRVFFSDTLDPQQDFKGFVRLSAGNPSVRVDGNVLQVYSDQPVQGEVTLTLEPGIRNRGGVALAALAQYSVVFASTKPQVRFTGAGVILPDAKLLSVPFEAVNVRSVQVTAFRVYDDNLTQFLQVNPLGGAYELGRVGRNLWRKTIALNAADLTRWNRFSLDVTELLKKHPGGLVRLTLSIGRGNAIYECGDQGASADEQLVDQDANDAADASSWDYVEEYYGVEDGSTWTDRDNPCKDAYYAYGREIRDARNFLVSNIGLLAKKDQRGRWIIVATDLRTATPLSGVRITALNFQNQSLAAGATDARGFAEFTLKSAPFTFVADKGGEKGYLKVQQGVALPVSHFDVGGEQVRVGLKGHIYGERGVWRPGDDIYLTFVLQDKEQTSPSRHPVTMELFNPQSQLTQTVVNTTPVNGFYAFKLATAEDAPTGNWTAKATLGGTSFTKTLKIETVAPNRLKVALDLEQSAAGALLTSAPDCGERALCDEPAKIRGKLFAQWLSGAVAAGLKADVKLRLTPAPTRFDRYADFTFDDPARTFASEPQDLFEGALDSQGNVAFEKTIEAIDGAPGMLSAALTSRVFERGGAFSINHAAFGFSPYQRYIGLKLPKGDVSRGMLRTDERHTVELASLSAAGEPTAMRNIEVTLYKIDWKWWWDTSGDSLAQYAQRTHTSVVQQSVVSSTGGKGAWQFEIKYPAWGRYLLRACDVDGGHCAGQTFYIDWPMWAGRAQDQSGTAASVLVFTADKEKYSVGETATIQLPETREGRALFTVESGTSILEARWIDFARDSNRITLPITQAMAPNIYASVTLVQPHGKANDRPIRLYGVIPLHVTDPGTSLSPVVNVAAEWRPNSTASVEVSERNQRAMTYTVAVVDEGLLDLTSFRTPNLHAEFYRREALGVSTWDLFDDVAGAYSADLERLLALGGSDSGPIRNPDERRTRFPPVVRYLGPFELKAGERKRHQIELPQYIGAVRVMVVAGQRGAYGSAEKSVFVRQPLMLLPTLPRVLGPEEEIAVPVSVFVSDPAIRQATVRIEADSAFEIVGEQTITLNFSGPEEQLAALRLRSKARLGAGLVKFTATGGQHHAAAEIHLDVRSPNPATTNRVQRSLEPGESWALDLTPHGLAGTNVVSLEVSAAPPLNLERRLHYLISYPYGCLEQTTSAVFPQLYLSSLLRLEDARKREIQRNVQDGVHRLSGFQAPNGGFMYWPGGFSAPDSQLRDTWSTSYAGHFLVEAKKLGYSVPEAMLGGWIRFQRATAQSWSSQGESESLDQAYRLYTLALAGQPEIGAMNRLRERSSLPASARWMLAAAYKLAGLADAAVDLVKNTPAAAADYAGRDEIFGSELRDNAIALTSLITLGRAKDAQPLADEVSRRLSSEDWHSTQSTAYALMSMAHYVGLGEFSNYTFERTIDGKTASTTVASPLYSTRLSDFPDRGAPVRIANTADRRLFVSFTTRGVPKSGADVAGAQGLSLKVEYRDEEGRPLDITRLPQGADLIAEIAVSNESGHRIDNIALAQLAAAGWEIHNERLEGLEATGARENADAPRPWWWDAAATATRAEYVDIRDDRIYRHFSLKPRERITFVTRFNAAYRGRYYLPGVAVEAMYDASRYARSKGQWVEVVEQ
jgi:hypothetical protein